MELTYLSKAGEEGYPNNLTVKVSYELTDENELIWKAEATTDAAAVIKDLDLAPPRRWGRGAGGLRC